MAQFKDSWLAHQRKRWMCPDAHRWFAPNYKTFFPQQRKAGFNPDQPRDELGQWTETGAEEEEAASGNEAETSRDIDEFGAARRDRANGHHYVTREIFDGPNLSEEARRVF